jgi:hypothetical protein
MYAAGDWLPDDLPSEGPDQERLTGRVPGTGRLITVVVEPRYTGADVWSYRPITAWRATAREAALWHDEFGP